MKRERERDCVCVVVYVDPQQRMPQIILRMKKKQDKKCSNVKTSKQKNHSLAITPIIANNIQNNDSKHFCFIHMYMTTGSSST